VYSDIVRGPLLCYGKSRGPVSDSWFSCDIFGFSYWSRPRYGGLGFDLYFVVLASASVSVVWPRSTLLGLYADKVQSFLILFDRQMYVVVYYPGWR